MRKGNTEAKLSDPPRAFVEPGAQTPLAELPHSRAIRQVHPFSSIDPFFLLLRSRLSNPSPQIRPHAAARHSAEKAGARKK